MPSSSLPCPCGNPLSFEQCCGPVLSGKQLPINAEALMRSRFSAYVLEDYDYILATYGPEQRQTLSVADLEQSAIGTKWLKLVVHGSSLNDLNAKVEFSGYYQAEQQFHVMYETSDFIFEKEQWYYTTGSIHKDSGFYIQQRNDLCLCNSGKKYKKCCA
jgi:SEC-C motif-containing protein